MELRGPLPVRRVDLEYRRRSMAGDIRKDSHPGHRASAGRQMKIEPQWVEACLGPFVPPTRSEVVVEVKERDDIEHWMNQRLDRRATQLGDDVRMPDIQTDPDPIRTDPVGQSPQDHRICRQWLDPREHGRQVLDRDRDAELLGARGKCGERTRLVIKRLH